MSSIDQQFVEYIVKSLVSNPDAVVIERRIDEKGVLLELTVDPEDLGRVIGKRGATAQSLRTLLRALGTKNDARYNLKIVDNGEPRPNREDQSRPERREDDQAVSADDSNSTGNDDSSFSGSTAADNNSSVSDSNDDDVQADDNSDMVSKTRKELEDLDDLEV